MNGKERDAPASPAPHEQNFVRSGSDHPEERLPLYKPPAPHDTLREAMEWRPIDSVPDTGGALGYVGDKAIASVYPDTAPSTWWSGVLDECDGWEQRRGSWPTKQAATAALDAALATRIGGGEAQRIMLEKHHNSIADPVVLTQRESSVVLDALLASRPPGGAAK